MDELWMEREALMDESVPAHDLAICFELAKPDVGFEKCQTYDEIWEVLHEVERAS
jgi:hypothetical protein